MTQKFAVDESRKNIYLEDEPEERTYQVRALYRGAIASAESTATLEEPWQLPNGDMEDWQDSERYTQPYYQPWQEAQWWDTNNNTTMPDDYSVYINYKCFPTTTYETPGFDNNGKAAVIRSVAVNRINSEIMGAGSTRGILYIGTTEDDGTLNEGKEWFSRPSKLEFKYKYSSYDGEHMGVEIGLYSSDGTRIAWGSFTSILGESYDSYQNGDVPLTYERTDLKPNSIQIKFQSVAGNESVSTRKTTISMPNGKSYKIYEGSVLTLDNIELIYTK